MAHGYVPDIQDYYAYTRRRNDLLQGCQGRIALLRGGILWRLSMEIYGEDGYWAEKALAMPADCRPSLTQFWLQGQVYLEDKLTKQEEDIICGVYRVLSDETSQGTWTHTAQVSFVNVFNSHWHQQRRVIILVAQTRPMESPGMRIQ